MVSQITMNPWPEGGPDHGTKALCYKMLFVIFVVDKLWWICLAHSWMPFINMHEPSTWSTHRTWPGRPDPASFHWDMKDPPWECLFLGCKLFRHLLFAYLFHLGIPRFDCWILDRNQWTSYVQDQRKVSLCSPEPLSLPRQPRQARKCNGLKMRAREADSDQGRQLRSHTSFLL